MSGNITAAWYLVPWYHIEVPSDVTKAMLFNMQNNQQYTTMVGSPYEYVTGIADGALLTPFRSYLCSS